jgi:uncharacterized protein
MTQPTAPVRGPARSDERALAPDLARGFMLLMIVLANTPWYLYGKTPGLSAVHPDEGSAFDRAAQLLIMTFIDMRVYPMFAFLFGYGMVQLFRRQVEAGTPVRTARRLLHRRNLWLMVFGFLHAALLRYGDVLGAYGLAGLIMVALFFKRRDQTLLIWAIALTGLLVSGTLAALMAAPFAAQVPLNADTTSFLATAVQISAIESYPESVVARLTFWPFLVLGQGVLTLVIPIMLLLAFWAGRQRTLEEPGRHLPLLRRVAAVGLAVGWSFGLVHAIDHVGPGLVPEQVFWVFSATQSVSGLFGGLGYVALFGLIGHRIAARRQPPGVGVVAITAVGKRSLSCYLAQSVICAPVLAAWGFGLGRVFGSASAALFASVSGCSLLCSRTPRSGPVSAARPRCCCAGRSTRGAAPGLPRRAARAGPAWPVAGLRTASGSCRPRPQGRRPAGAGPPARSASRAGTGRCRFRPGPPRQPTAATPPGCAAGRGTAACRLR